MRRTLAMFAVVALGIVGGVSVAAMGSDDGGNAYTGCLNKGGSINKVAIGGEPARPCRGEQVQISWSEGVPPAEFEALAERVAALEASDHPLEMFVDCAAGDTITAALAEGQDHPGAVNIRISGVCDENLFINRSNVALSGLKRSDGITVTSGSPVTINARGVGTELSNLTITGGDGYGIAAREGSNFTVVDVTVRDAPVWGILVEGGASGSLNGCEVSDSGFGVAASGGSLFINGCSMFGNDFGLMAEGGGSVKGFAVNASGNLTNGVVSQGGATVWLNDSTIRDNGSNGINILNHATASIGTSTIANNNGFGASAESGSHVTVFESTVEGNTTDGVHAGNASSVALSSAIVTANGGDGILLEDQSSGAGGDPGTVITGNGGFGINCAGPADFPEVQNGFDIPATSFSGNGNGDTNCP